MAARVLHVVDLADIGGVEQKLRFYLQGSTARGRIQHHLFLRGGRPHPDIRDDVMADAVSVSLGKFRWGLRIPGWLPRLRQLSVAACVSRVAPDAILIWNRLGESGLIDALAAATDAPILHCECGGAWGRLDPQAVDRYLGRISSVICASRACKRMLELRWGWQGTVAAVCNGLRPDCRAEGLGPKQLSRGGTVSLGVAARMVPIKGICLAVQALRTLLDRGYDVELHLAGGGDRAGQKRLKTLVGALGLSERVRFHGIVRDMVAFYRIVHILLCPSIREPFGSVCVEAAAQGCVVVATGVDGLVEAVQDGVTGLCIAPDTPLPRYMEFAGNSGRFPIVTYDPNSDSLRTPSFMAPETLAEVVGRLIEAPDDFVRFSAAAIRRSHEELHFDGFIDALDNALLNAIA